MPSGKMPIARIAATKDDLDYDPEDRVEIGNPSGQSSRGILQQPFRANTPARAVRWWWDNRTATTALARSPAHWKAFRAGGL